MHLIKIGMFFKHPWLLHTFKILCFPTVLLTLTREGDFAEHPTFPDIWPHLILQLEKFMLIFQSTEGQTKLFGIGKVLKTFEKRVQQFDDHFLHLCNIRLQYRFKFFFNNISIITICMDLFFLFGWISFQHFFGI